MVGSSKEAYTHLHNAVMLESGSLRLTPITFEYSLTHNTKQDINQKIESGAVRCTISIYIPHKDF